jgi:hypothetical protein
MGEAAYPKLIYYNKLDKGGHFAAREQPQLFKKQGDGRVPHLNGNWKYQPSQSISASVLRLAFVAECRQALGKIFAANVPSESLELCLKAVIGIRVEISACEADTTTGRVMQCAHRDSVRSALTDEIDLGEIDQFGSSTVQDRLHHKHGEATRFEEPDALRMPRFGTSASRAVLEPSL